MLQLYSQDGNKKAELQPNGSSVQDKEVQAGNVLSLGFTLYRFMAIDVNDYVDYLGERYWAVERYLPAEKSSVEWEYNIRLYAIDSLVRRFLVLNNTDGENDSVFTLTARPIDHARLIVKSINDGMGQAASFRVGTVNGTDNVVIRYEGKYCDEALKELAEAVGVEWWFDGETLNLCRCEHGIPIALGYGEGLTNLEHDKADNAKFYTRLFPIGSSRNIDPERYGCSRLQLPGGAKYADIDGLVAKYGIIHHYEQKAFSGIYPRRVGVVSSVRSEEVQDTDGNPFMIYYFSDDDLPFDPNEYEIGTLVKRVSFQEGSELAGLGADDGHYFEVNYDSQTREFEIITIWPYDDGRQLPGGSLVPKVGDKYVLWNIRMPDEYYGLAEAEFRMKVDEYNRKNTRDVSRYKATTDHVWMEDTGTELFIGSRVRLKSTEYFPPAGYRESRVTRIRRNVSIPGQMDLEISDALSTGTLESINDAVNDAKSYAGSLVEAMNVPALIRSRDTTKASDANVFSALRSLREFVSKKKDDIMEGLLGLRNGAWFGSKYWYVDDDGNARLNGMAADDLHVHKNAQFDKGLTVGNFTGESGGALVVDEYGRSYGEVDRLKVRMKAYFESLEVQEVNTAGGKVVVSPAGAVTLAFVDEHRMVPSGAGEADNGIPDGVYRCYFLGEQDGVTVENRWKAGDQAMSRTFNVTAGVHQGVSNHYYWRLVTAVSDETTMLEDNGLKYHWIDLSKPDCDTGSDAPVATDVVAQVGSRTDKTRQNALIFSSVDIYSPSVTLYHGIDNYTFLNKEYVDYGVNKSTDKAFLNVYGDFYSGDRRDGNEKEYVKYENGKVDIAGTLHIGKKSTIDGTPVDQYIKDNGGLTEEEVRTLIGNDIDKIQNQLDGAIETWFYPGEPTLTSLPASGWTSDDIRDVHLGDLYYDKDTGYGYRFMYDDTEGEYLWYRITDNDIIKALDSAARAQETADGKMKVFARQPLASESYDAGDLWVNATYPADGSTYTNDILRAVARKEAGDAFSILHWQPASRYTDDTKALQAIAEIANTRKSLEDLGKNVVSFKSDYDSFASDGVFTSAEVAALQEDARYVESIFQGAKGSYDKVVSSSLLLDDGNDSTEKTGLMTAFSQLQTAKTELVAVIQNAVADYKADSFEGAVVSSRYSNFNNAYNSFYQALNIAERYITDKTVETSYKGLDKRLTALASNFDTEIQGGLILSSMLALRGADGKTINAGLNGVQNAVTDIASWWGGPMKDKQQPDNTFAEDGATSLIRFDGSGYFANGAIWWDTTGQLHADPLSFFVGDNYVGLNLALFQFVPNGATRIEDVSYVVPKAPFKSLDITDHVDIGKIRLSWDAASNALKIGSTEDGKTASLYATGGVSSLGFSPDGGGGDGGATMLSDLLDVSVGGQTQGQVLGWDGNGHWVPMSVQGGLDEGALGSYLTTNNYAKKSDIPSLSGYATQQWVEGKGYLTSHQTLHTLTVQRNGVQVGTFKPSADATINISDVASAATLSSHTGNTTVHITAAERTAWNKVVADFAAITGTDTDTIINKWEEVVAFLDTYTEADTLAGLLGNKVDKEAGKGLSSNDFTDALLTKLNGIEAGANKYVHPTATATTIAAASGRVLSAVTVNSLGHVTSVSSKTLAAADIPSLDWGKITTGKPTTLSGYGITDAYTKTEADNRYVNATGDAMSGNLVFADIVANGSNVVNSVGLKWAGGTDGANIFYRLTASDAGKLVLNMVDDANTEIDFEWSGSAFNGGVSKTPYRFLYNSLLASEVAATFKSLKIGDCEITWDAASGGLKFSKGIYSEGFVSSLGASAGGGTGGGVDMTTVWEQLGKNTAEQINPSHLTSALAGYATESWVNSQGFLKSITKSQVESVLTGNITTHTHSQYLTSASLADYYTKNEANGYYHSNTLTSLISGISSLIVTFDKSGITGAPSGTSWLNGFISTHNNYLSSIIVNSHRSNAWYAGWVDSYIPNPSVHWVELIHSGNIGSYAITAHQTLDHINNLGLLDAVSGTTTMPSGLRLYSVYNNGYPKTYGNLLRIGGMGSGELYCGWEGGEPLTGRIYYRSKRDVSSTAWGLWERIAYTSDMGINNGVITINGTSITPLTSHQSLANYVTLNGAQTITGTKTFNEEIIANTKWIIAKVITGETAAGTQTKKAHSIELGYSGRDYFNFNEYEGVFNFYKTKNVYQASSGDGTLVAKITENGITASSFVKSGGTSSQFLKADGSVDGTAYLSASSYTAADVLAKLKTVDGPGSGLDADLLDGVHKDGFVLSTGFRLSQYNQGYWMKVLTFTIPSGAFSSSISFSLYPSECNRDRFFDLNINIRNNNILFYIFEKSGHATFKCVGDGTTFTVWLQCNKNGWDGYGIIVHKNSYDVNSYDYAIREYQDAEPTGTYSAYSVRSGHSALSDIATRLQTPRTLTVGNTGKSFDGSANVAWSLAEIGALPAAGGTMTGSLTLKGQTTDDMSYAGNVHPMIRFDNVDSSQNVALIFTDYDSYRSPAGLKLVGNQGNEWFEAPRIYATSFYGALSGNATSASKLATARSIWGQSFDGTGNVSGLLTATVGASHSGIKLGDTYLTAINGQLIFQNNSQIRFGGDSWDYNVWAGLKYDPTSKTVYLGVADGSVFTANNAQTGHLTLAGITQMNVPGKINFSGITGATVRDILYAPIADNDYFRIRVGGTATNAGFAEIATADDGNEPIYVRQYTGVFSTVARTLTLLDTDGSTTIPSNLNVNSTVRIKTTTGSYSEGIRLYGSTTSDSWSNIHFGCDLTANNGTHANQWILGRNASNNFVLDVNGSAGNIMTWLKSGNVGIGNTNPSYKLDVNGDAIVRGWLRTTGNRGWYSETYGGGWYMSDSSWLRTHNSKGIFTNSGQIYTTSSVRIGDCTISWDSANNALKFDKTIYSTGGVSALGANTSTSGGGGGLDWAALAASTNEQINKSHLATALSEYCGIAQELTARKVFSQNTWILKSNENNEIRNVYYDNSTIGQGSLTSLNAIRNAISFQWYGTNWEIGNVRGGSTDTEGFGIGLRNSGNKVDLGLLVKKDYVIAQGFYKYGYNDNYVLLAGGGVKALSSLGGGGVSGLTSADTEVVCSKHFNLKGILYIDDDDFSRPSSIYEDSDGLNLSSEGQLYSACRGGVYVGYGDIELYDGKVYAKAFTNTSDIRRKNVVSGVDLSMSQIADAPLFRFTWRNEGDYSGIHAGTSAQYWADVLPEAVSRDKKGFLSIQYDVIALLSTVTVARKVMSHEERISELEAENERLRKEINELKKVA